eukprot:gene3229-3709_t
MEINRPRAPYASILYPVKYKKMEHEEPLFALINRGTVASAPFPAANGDSHGKGSYQHHLLGHHHNQFEKDVPQNFAKRTTLEQHTRKQHFVAGRPQGGSASNGLLYGSGPATAPQLGGHCVPSDRNSNNNDTDLNKRKHAGFLYGFEDTQVGQPTARKTKTGLPSWMQDKSSAELRKRDMQAREIEDDITRSRLEKARQMTKKQAEQKKDLEMLQSYRPWGKPGGGAPRKIDGDKTTTSRTREVEHLTRDSAQVLPLGKPGYGAPNRSDSGRVLTKLQGDNHIRIQAHKDGRPIDYLPPPMKNQHAYEYRTELDRQAEESRIRRNHQREDEFKKDIETLNYNPYGRPGAGAPLKDQDGSPRTGLPLQFSNDIYELRQTEPRHGNTFANNEAEEEQQLLIRKHNKPAPLAKPEQDSKDINDGFQFGMPGGGAPIRDSKGNVMAHAPRTLIKDRTGAIVKSSTRKSNTSGNEYFPFGKPGAGAPIKNEKGHLQTNVAGKIDRAKLGRDGNSENLQSKKEYLSMLQRMQEEREVQKHKERNERLEPAPEVSTWIKRGRVGQPRYDPNTNEIRANPLATSDITRQKMNIHQQASDRSKDYHDQLDAFSRQREAQKQKDLLEQRQKSVEHARTMESVWGRPGNGAPLDNTKRAKVDMNPVDFGMKYRDN